MAKQRQRRMRGTGTITRRKDGLWIGRVTIDGRRHQVTSMDREKLMEKLEQARADLKAMGYVADRTTTFQVWSERWLADFTGDLRGKTWATYASLLRRHVQPRIGSKAVAAITPADVRGVNKAITAAGLSSTTALQAYRVLSMCLEDARREELITENVCTRVDAPKKRAASRGAFTVEQTRDLLHAAAEMPDGSRHIIALLTGMRQSERLGLTIESLNLDEGFATVDWQLQELQYEHGCGPRSAAGYPCGKSQGARCPRRSFRVPDDVDYRILAGRMALTPPKSRHGIRAVPLIPPAVAAIRAHLKTTTGQPNPHDLVWHTSEGGPIMHADDQASWRTLVTSVGLPATATTHWARHSVATLLMEAGIDAHVIGEIVGHGSVAVTRGYQHVSSALAMDAMKKLGELIAA